MGHGSVDKFQNILIYLLTFVTGNAWAAAGMFRVLETIRNSEHAKELADEQADLTSWIDEIITATWSYQVRYEYRDTYNIA